VARAAFIATGDFNDEAIEDFAVAVIDRKAGMNNFTLVVFNGPSSARSAPPVFLKRGLNLKTIASFTSHLSGRSRTVFGLDPSIRTPSSR